MCGRRKCTHTCAKINSHLDVLDNHLGRCQQQRFTPLHRLSSAATATAFVLLIIWGTVADEQACRGGCGQGGYTTRLQLGILTTSKIS